MKTDDQTDDQTALTMDRLRLLCWQYDQRSGQFPENPWEGWAVLSFIEATLRGEAWTSPPPAPRDWVSEEGGG